jgi:YARHG domain
MASPMLSVALIDFPSTQVMVFLLGAFLIVVGIVGGGFELKEIKIPSVARIPRIIAGVAGAVLIAFSLGLLPTHGNSPQAPQAQAPQVQTPQAQTPQTRPAQPTQVDSSPAPRVDSAQAGEPFFMTRKITASDLAGKSQAQARLMRNEIYARKGRRFKDPTLQQYFDAQSWYHPQYSPEDFPPGALSTVQQQNILILQSYEEGHL